MLLRARFNNELTDQHFATHQSFFQFTMTKERETLSSKPRSGLKIRRIKQRAIKS